MGQENLYFIWVRFEADLGRIPFCHIDEVVKKLIAVNDKIIDNLTDMKNWNTGVMVVSEIKMNESEFKID